MSLRSRMFSPGETPIDCNIYRLCIIVHFQYRMVKGRQHSNALTLWFFVISWCRSLLTWVRERDLWMKESHPLGWGHSSTFSVPASTASLTLLAWAGSVLCPSLLSVWAQALNLWCAEQPEGQGPGVATPSALASPLHSEPGETETHPIFPPDEDISTYEVGCIGSQGKRSDHSEPTLECWREIPPSHRHPLSVPPSEPHPLCGHRYGTYHMAVAGIYMCSCHDNTLYFRIINSLVLCTFDGELHSISRQEGLNTTPFLTRQTAVMAWHYGNRHQQVLNYHLLYMYVPWLQEPAKEPLLVLVLVHAK